jgi:hypothetical protein
MLRYFPLILFGLLFHDNYAQKTAVNHAEASKKEPLKVALLVHVYTFDKEKLDNLPTEKSLSLMQNTLKKQGFRDENIISIPSDVATSSKVREEFHHLEKKVKGQAGAVVAVLLDSHGIEVPDLNGDEKKINIIDEFDEAFACKDYQGIDPSSNPYPNGYILDDELGVYYDNILREIGPNGHLVVFTAGCHSTTQMKGNPGRRVTGAPAAIVDYPAQSPKKNPSGKFIYFASVVNDSDKVKPLNTRNKRSSYLVHGISEALGNLKPNSNYHDLLVDAQHVIDRDRVVSDRGANITQLNIPLDLNKNRFEKVFRGFTRTESYLDVVSNVTADFLKTLSDVLRQSFEGKKGESDSGPLVVAKGGLPDGLFQNGVVELTDKAGNFVVSGTIVSLDESASVVRLDYPVDTPDLKIRRPTPTLAMHADATVPSRIADLLGGYISLADSPDNAPLRLSCRNGSYELCASGLPYTASGCASYPTESLLLAKIRNLALYQLLKYKERKNGPVVITDTVQHAGIISLNETISIPGNILADKTTTIKVVMRMSGMETEKLHYQFIDVLPDQPLTEHTLTKTGYLGRALSVQIPTANNSAECCMLMPSGTYTITINDILPPYGLEENILVYSRTLLDLRSVIEGKTPITTELINSIEYVDTSSYHILPDRQRRKK